MRPRGAQERVSEGNDVSEGPLDPPLSSVPRLTFPLPLLLVTLLTLTIVRGAAEKNLPDLSPYPWLYLRSGEPLASGESAVEMIALGDVMVGRDVSGKVFDDVRCWLRTADVVVGNLESVIVDDPEGHHSHAKESEFILHAPPSAATESSDAGFTVLGLANNHALDLGPEGLEETVSHLQTAGIAVVGAGPDAEAALQPLVRDVRGVRMALVAFNALPDSRSDLRDGGWTVARWDRERAIATVEAVANDVDALVISVHWGYQYQTRVDPAQRDAAQALLDAGADLVVGHHPHVVQTFEIGGRGAVAFSLGNFVFDQQHGETGRGLALRAFFDQEGLRAVQAIPVWAGPRPRLMTAEEGDSLLGRVEPSPHRLRFTCHEEGCAPVEAASQAPQPTPSGLFWGDSIDLTGDGRPEHVRRVSEEVVIYEDGVEVWRSPRDWRVVDLAVGDPNDDGRNELLLALWKPGLDGLESPDSEEEQTPRSRPFIVGYRGGEYRTLWGGSAVARPICEVELGDVDGDGAQELIVLEGSDESERTVSVWVWHGWGFTLKWRSQSGEYADLKFDEDRFFSVGVK